jgi:hypothetical protein
MFHQVYRGTFHSEVPSPPSKIIAFVLSAQASGVARRDNLFVKGFSVTLSKIAVESYFYPAGQ